MMLVADINHGPLKLISLIGLLRKVYCSGYKVENQLSQQLCITIFAYKKAVFIQIPREN